METTFLYNEITKQIRCSTREVNDTAHTDIPSLIYQANDRDLLLHHGSTQTSCFHQRLERDNQLSLLFVGTSRLRVLFPAFT